MSDRIVRLGPRGRDDRPGYLLTVISGLRSVDPDLATKPFSSLAQRSTIVLENSGQYYRVNESRMSPRSFIKRAGRE